MTNGAQSSDWITTKPSNRSVAATLDQLRRVIEERDLTLFRIIDHSGQAEEAGISMPDTKLVMFGNPAKGSLVMVASPLAALDLPLKILVWDDGNGTVSMSYHSPDFMAERYGVDGARRGPFDAIAAIVDAVADSQ